MPSLRRWHLSQDLKEIREFSQRTGQRTLQEKGTGGAKASRSECLAYLRTAKLDSSEQAGENIRYGGRQVTGKSDTDSVKIWGLF